jgi:hypothetical protein
LDQIIGPFQSSFLPGRGTCDNAIILQEVIHSMKKSKKKKGDVVYKIDLEKAYDNVNWDFLRFCLTQFGFPPITIDLIMHCVTASSLSLSFEMVIVSPRSPQLEVLDKATLYPRIYLSCAWKAYHTLFCRL